MNIETLFYHLSAPTLAKVHEELLAVSKRYRSESTEDGDTQFYAAEKADDAAERARTMLLEKYGA